MSKFDIDETLCNQITHAALFADDSESVHEFESGNGHKYVKITVRSITKAEFEEFRDDEATA